MKPRWKVWATTLGGELFKGSARQFETESAALSYAVESYRAGDSGQTLKTFAVCDTGTRLANKRVYRLREDKRARGDTGYDRTPTEETLRKMESEQKEAHKGAMEARDERVNITISDPGNPKTLSESYFLRHIRKHTESDD